MTEIYPTDAELNDLSGTTDSEQEVLFIPTGESPYYTSFYKTLFRLLDVSRRAGDLRVYKDGDLTFGVRSGRFMDGLTEVIYGGESDKELTNNEANSIYLWNDGGTATVSVSTSGFPDQAIARHIPLAVITTSGGGYDVVDNLSDRRAPGIWRLPSPLCKRTAVKAFGAVYFSGRPADDELLTINGRKYEIDTDGDFPQSAGDVVLDLQGNSTLNEDITDIASAINGDGSATVDAVADTNNGVLWLIAKTAGSAGSSITLTEGLSNATVSDATLAGGADAAVAALAVLRHTITAGEEAGQLIRFQTGLTSIESYSLSFEDNGVHAAFPGTVAISGGAIVLDSATWAAGDIVSIIAIGTE